VPERDETNDEGGGGRPFWSGMLSFGLVSVPVDLLPAHSSSRAPLRMLDADGTPLARRYFCPADEQEVDADQLERGYELDDGTIVVVTDEELEAQAPKKSREIDLRRFVDRDSIDPLYFERSYFLAPGKGSGKAYRLLASVMESSRRAGIASFVMREKEYLVAIFAEGGLLRGETLRFADQVRSIRSVGLPKPTRVDAAAVKRMSRAVSTLAKKSWNPSELSDPHEAIRQLAQRKFEKGQDVIRSRAAAAQDTGGEIVDLMQVLRDSLAQERSRREEGAGTSGRHGAPSHAAKKGEQRRLIAPTQPVSRQDEAGGAQQDGSAPALRPRAQRGSVRKGTAGRPSAFQRFTTG
jgi:DNA end-binding protein Ku